MVERTLREAGVCVRQTFKGPPLKVSLQPGPTCEGPLTPQNSTAWDMGLSGMFHCHPITVLQLRKPPQQAILRCGLGKGQNAPSQLFSSQKPQACQLHISSVVCPLAVSLS